jgi:hypothetical protein
VETLRRAHGVANAVVDEVLAPLDESERDALRDLLRKLAGLDAASAKRPRAAD